MDAIAQNAAELCDAVDAVVWRVDGKASTSLYTLDRPMRQVQEEYDEIDRAFTLAAP